MTPEEDKQLITILTTRDGLLTNVELRDGKRMAVWNIAWGYDMGDEYAHITTNISPSKDGHPVEFFFSNDVVELIDTDSKTVIISFQ